MAAGFENCQPADSCSRGDEICSCGILYGQRFWRPGCGDSWTGQPIDCKASLGLTKTDVGWEKLGFWCFGKLPARLPGGAPPASDVATLPNMLPEMMPSNLLPAPTIRYSGCRFCAWCN